MYQLSPFISAYKPHGEVITTKDLDKDDRRDSESPLSQDNILDTYQATKHQKDLTYLGYKRKYLTPMKGYRSYYSLGLNS
jgi:hypothetical protein